MEFKNVRFLGGLDIRLIREWHIDWLSKMKIKVLAIAFDMPNVEEHLKRSLKLLHQGGISHGVIYCFVLGGFFEWDTPEKAENRCRLVLKNGATPFGMYYKGPGASVRKKPVEWGKWASRWAYMPGIYAMAKREKLETYQDTLK